MIYTFSLIFYIALESSFAFFRSCHESAPNSFKVWRCAKKRVYESWIFWKWYFYDRMSRRYVYESDLYFHLIFYIAFESSFAFFRSCHESAPNSFKVWRYAKNACMSREFLQWLANFLWSDTMYWIKFRSLFEARKFWCFNVVLSIVPGNLLFLRLFGTFWHTLWRSRTPHQKFANICIYCFL